MPAVWLKKRWDSDVLTLVQSRGRAAQGMVAVIYSAYFLYVAAYFLLPYTDMFCKKYYTETNPCPVAFLLLACCVYAAFKGANVITRFGIFLFVLAMVTNFMMFGGSLSSLDMHNGSLGWQGNPADFGNHVIYFVTPCFIAALFACLSGDATRFRVHQIVTALGWATATSARRRSWRACTACRTSRRPRCRGRPARTRALRAWRACIWRSPRCRCS